MLLNCLAFGYCAIMRNLVHAVVKVDSYWRQVSRVFAGCSGMLIFVMALLVASDVLLRNILGKPITGAVEVTQLMMPAIIFLALAYALAQGAHVRVSLLIGRLPPQSQLWAEIFACVVGVVFCVVLLYFAFLYCWEAVRAKELIMAAVKLPWWPSKVAMVVGLFVFSLQFFLILLLNLTKRISRGKVPAL